MIIMNKINGINLHELIDRHKEGLNSAEVFLIGY